MADKLKNVKIKDLILPSVLLREEDPKSDDIIELAASIKLTGLIEPVIVTPYEENKMLLVAGWRRVCAHNYLEIDVIRAIVREMPEEQYLVQRFEENGRRKDNTPVEIATHLNEMLKLLHCKQADLAVKLGRSEGYVSQHLALLSGYDFVLAALRSGEIYFAVARELNQVNSAEKAQQLMGYAITGGASSDVVRNWRLSANIEPIEYEAGEEVPEQTPINIEDLNKFVCESCRQPHQMQNVSMIKVCTGCRGTILQALANS